MAGTDVLAQDQADAAGDLRRAQGDYAKLRDELARVNGEVSDLKRADRSVRADYRLRERMADAEALAQKLTQAERRLRALGDPRFSTAGETPPIMPPQASPQDGTVELEAKADLLVDQARKIDGQADKLTKIANELRTRKTLRRRAGAWDRDPFAGLENGRRNLTSASATTKSAATTTTGDSTRGATSTGAAAASTGTTTLAVGSGTVGGTSSSNTATLAPSTQTTDTSKDSSSETASAAKSSPLPTTLGLGSQSVEQRLFLDPTTAAELRQALGKDGALSDPDALDHAATALRARARALKAQAQVMGDRSHRP